MRAHRRMDALATLAALASKRIPTLEELKREQAEATARTLSRIGETFSHRLGNYALVPAGETVPEQRLLLLVDFSPDALEKPAGRDWDDAADPVPKRAFAIAVRGHVFDVATEEDLGPTADVMAAQTAENCRLVLRQTTDLPEALDYAVRDLDAVFAEIAKPGIEIKAVHDALDFFMTRATKECMAGIAVGDLIAAHADLARSIAPTLAGRDAGEMAALEARLHAMPLEEALAIAVPSAGRQWIEVYEMMTRHPGMATAVPANDDTRLGLTAAQID